MASTLNELVKEFEGKSWDEIKERVDTYRAMGAKISWTERHGIIPAEWRNLYIIDEDQLLLASFSEHRTLGYMYVRGDYLIF